MGIKDKQTYGEYYWAMQVDAQKYFADESEKAVAPYLSALLNDVPIIPELPDSIKNFIEVLKKPSSFGFLPFMAGVGVNAIDEFLDIMFDSVFLAAKRDHNKRFKSTWLTSDEVNILWARKKIPEGLWNEVTAGEGYEDVLASMKYESQLSYPSIPDLVLYSRYHGDPDNVWSEFQKWFNISPRDYPVWEWLGKQRITTLQAQTAFRRKLISEPELYEELARIGWGTYDRGLIEELGWTIPNAMLLTQGNLLQRKSNSEILADISIADIKPEYAQTYLDAVLTKPASQDIIAYELRRSPELTNLGAELKRIGIHDDYHSLYKELAYQIPPVADIITMAVREAFTPDIAARFGQYEDFPKELETWGMKKGLSAEWTQRYWAAHWSLPSPQQGFEMLHRGLIDRTELDMLLRALDVMPFWREKLTGIAYRRLTRVDVRRMYSTGVLTEKEVFDTYSELGYNDRDAARMSEFTVRQVLATQSKFTAKDVINAYSKYMINRSEASTLLRELGVRPENVSFIITTAEYKREWALTENRISAIRNLYKKKVYTPDKARAELLRLDMPSERVDVLMEQWYIDEKDKPPRYWTTAQTLSFIKEGLITPERGIYELKNIGYDDEHINVYVRASQ